MNRPAFTLLSAASLTLCLLSAALCACNLAAPNITVHAQYGSVAIEWTHPDRYLQPDFYEGRPFYESKFGVGHYLATYLPSPKHGHPAGTITDRYLELPDWFLLILFGLPPALWLALRLLRDRNARRLGARPCPQCGYDLRATTGPCPECGAPIPTNSN